MPAHENFYQVPETQLEPLHDMQPVQLGVHELRPSHVVIDSPHLLLGGKIVAQAQVHDEAEQVRHISLVATTASRLSRWLHASVPLASVSIEIV